jgi:magnesium chelatase subunit I
MSADELLTPQEQQSKTPVQSAVRSLRELIDHYSAKSFAKGLDALGDEGLAERVPFPFLAIVGQAEMKLALLLGLVNPNIGGILLIGPRGTGKTTAVRSLLDLLPTVDRSTCFYGCLPEDIETGGIESVCPECAQKYGEGKPLTISDRVRLVELPLNARLEDVVGGIDERAAANNRTSIRRGILAQADRNLLYIDEINLLGNEIVDAILDAAAQGIYTVRRGPVSATYRARLVLIGSMNPEEGNLRPQILDRFGLRVIVKGLENAAERLEAYRRVQSHLANPRGVAQTYASDSQAALQEIQSARQRLKQAFIPDALATEAIRLVQDMRIDSLRAELTWFESARAYASSDARHEVQREDLRAVAPMSLRLRRSEFMEHYFDNQQNEEEELRDKLNRWGRKKPTAVKKKKER